MKKVVGKINTYECKDGEMINLTFVANPADNGQIVQKWDTESEKDVDIDAGISKKFLTSEVSVKLTFGFIKRGQCVISIAGDNGVVDTKTAEGDDITRKTLHFIPR